MESDSGVGTGEKGSSVQGGSSSGYDSASMRSGSSGCYSNPREAMESDSGVGTGMTGETGSSVQGGSSSGYDSASTVTDGTLQGGQSIRSDSSGFHSNPREGNNPGSFLDSLPKQNMIDVFLRSETQIKDKNTATRIQIRPDQTISDLQDMVQTKTEIHPGQQYLYHEDTRTVLSSSTRDRKKNMEKAARTMAQCNVKHGSWLKYSLNTRGGGGSVY